MRGALWAVAALLALLLAGSYGGALHGVGDSLAVVRWQIALGLLLAGAALGLAGARRGWLLLPLALLGAAPVIWAYARPQAAPAEPRVVLYQKNLSFRLADPAPVIADILESRPDVVTLQEVTKPNMAVLEGLKAMLPTQAHCGNSDVGGVAIAARWPEIPGTRTCRPGAGSVLALQLDTPDGPLWAVSLHLTWPWPEGSQRSQVEKRVGRLLDVVEGPAVMGGDFNMVPWGTAPAHLAQVTGTVRIGRALPSYPPLEPLMPLPIDHVYGPAGSAGSAEPRPVLGSDHRGVLARFGW